MPAPRKIDLIPREFRDWLAAALEARGFGDIVQLTEELNGRLAEEGVELSIGKSAVGEFSKALKDQREAMGLAETLLADMDIGKESDLHRVLMQMIATAAVKLMRSSAGEDAALDSKDLMQLGRMLRDLMSSAGIREQLLEAERKRIAQEAREEAAAELEDKLAGAEAKGDLTAAAARQARQIMGFEA